MLYNCPQMNNVEKILMQKIEHYIYCQKTICRALQWNAFLMGLICHAMSLHPEYVTRIPLQVTVW